MSGAKIWVVRIADPMLALYRSGVELPPREDAKAEALTRFLEQLRYAGIATIHERGFYDLHPPLGVSATRSHFWARQKAARMETFGYNAVAAPAWPAP